MKIIGKTIIISILSILLAACNALAPAPTATPAPTETSLPTPTNTAEPTSAPTETPAAPVLTMPSGEPEASWEGIPVMPDALAGEGDSEGYSFTINASPDEIEKFYGKELAKLGWNMFASGQGTTESILLIFMKDDASTLSVSIIPQPDGVMYVLLVK